MNPREDQLKSARATQHEALTDGGQKPAERNLSTMLWGTTLVILGALFLLDQLEVIDQQIFHDWWPLALIVIGIFSRGHVLTAIGSWLLVGKLGLFGLSYSSAWPVILMVIGAGIVVDVIIGNGKSHRCASLGNRGGSR